MHKHLITVLTLLSSATLVACSSTKSASYTDDQKSGLGNAIILTAASGQVALGGTTTVTVSGGTGLYVGASATVGTLTAGSVAGAFTYTAPTTSSATMATLTVTDSAGLIGTGVVMIGTGSGGGGGTGGGGTGSLGGCAGTYTANLAGNPAVVSVIQDTAGRIAGSAYFTQYQYWFPFTGTCALGASSVSSGTIAFTDLMQNWRYNGSFTLSSGGQIQLSGSVIVNNTTYQWSAYSTAIGAAPVATAMSCGGTYNAQIGPNAGTVYLVDDGAGRVEGYFKVQTYYYSISGSCTGSGATKTVSLKNNTTGSQYTGTATFNGASVSMLGTYSLTDGTSYNWSATR